MAGILSVQQIQGLATAADPTTVEISSGHTLYAPGHVIQVEQARTTALFTHNAGSSTWSSNITNLEVTLTPKSTSSKILIFANVFAGTNNNSYPALWQVRLMRGSTSIAADFLRHHQSASADNASGGGSTASTYLDSPATTSSITYGLQIRQRISGSSLATYVNGGQAGATGDGRSSSIMAMEIAA
jgi:hypothetical protein